MKKERSASRVIFAVILINMITNPIANLLYPEHSFWLIESGVLVAEALLFALLFEVSMKKGSMLSLAANIPTIALSLAMFAL